jgi:hypothetical protein
MDTDGLRCPLDTLNQEYPMDGVSLVSIGHSSQSVQWMIHGLDTDDMTQGNKQSLPSTPRVSLDGLWLVRSMVVWLWEDHPMDGTLKTLNWTFLDKPSIGWFSGRANLKNFVHMGLETTTCRHQCGA